MAHPQPLVMPDAVAPSAARQQAKPVASPAGTTAPAWSLLALVGAAFLVVGLTDVGLAWYPFALGTPEWEVATISATLNGMPVPTLGLGLLAASGLVTGRRWLTIVAGVVALLLALFLVACALVFALDVPLALNAVQQPVVRVGLLKGMAKAGVASAAYVTLFGVLAWRTLRSTSSR